MEINTAEIIMRSFSFHFINLSMALLCFSCNSHKSSSSAVNASQAFGSPIIKRGMNLGNALEAPVPGEWGVTIQPEYFEVIKKSGLDTVRIPVRFSAHAHTDPPYLLDPEFMQMVDLVIHQAFDAGLNVILDFHHFDELTTDPAGQHERFLAIWDQLADHYQEYPDNLYFEILNEPCQNLDAKTWNELATECIRVIRESNPDRLILAGGIDYNSIESLDLLSLPDDKNLLAVFHFYYPFEFTHQGAAWAEGSNEWIGTTWEATSEEMLAITEQLDRAAAWSASKQIPLIMGEFGSISSADAESRQRWTEFVRREAEKRNIGWLYWEFCSGFGIYDREQQSWDLDMLNALTSQ